MSVRPRPVFPHEVSSDRITVRADTMDFKKFVPLFHDLTVAPHRRQGTGWLTLLLTALIGQNEKLSIFQNNRDFLAWHRNWDRYTIQARKNSKFWIVQVVKAANHLSDFICGHLGISVSPITNRKGIRSPVSALNIIVAVLPVNDKCVFVHF